MKKNKKGNTMENDNTIVQENLGDAGNAQATPLSTAAEEIATEAIPTAVMTRDEMLAHLAISDPGIDYSEDTDDELREKVAASEPPLEPPADDEEADEEAKDDEDLAPIESVDAALASGADPLEVIKNLQSQINKLSKGKPRKVASGSKPRPNVIYTLLNKPPAWHATPQVAQLEQILFSQPKTSLTEPEVFELVRAGKEAGILRTKQDAVRIFQYYRSRLLDANVLRWK